MKKISLIFISVSCLFLFSNYASAFSISVGVPMSYTVTGKTGGETTLETESTSGYLIGIQLPFAIGIGMDSYKSVVKNATPKVATDVYNIFYQLPIPIINLVVGLGTGNQKIECSGCDSVYKKGSLTQWYTSIGMPIIPFFDIHLSYRSITSKNVKVKSNAGNAIGEKADNSRSITGVGIAFNF